jgi:hypothetical protein
MDPITLIVTALAAGAAAGLKPTAEQAVKDAYQALKELIRRKYAAVAPTVDYLEARPERERVRQDLHEELAATAAGQDAELLTQAQAVLKAVQQKAPEAAATIGVDLKDIRAGASLKISDIVAQSSGTGPTVGVRGEHIETAQDLIISGVRISSGSPHPAPPPSAAAATPIKILFLAANPSDTTQLRLGEESRRIDEALRQAEYRDRFELEQANAVRVADLQGLLLRYRPHIVHFSGHGSAAAGATSGTPGRHLSTSEAGGQGSMSGAIILEDEAGHSHPVSVHALRTVFSLLKDNLRCVVLNACYSEPQAQAIAEHIDCVVGMSTAITDKAAIHFAAAFYQALGYGRDVKTAFALGRAQIDLENIPEAQTPQLLATRVDPAQVVLVGSTASGPKAPAP